jgi:hypothetical protein
MATLYMLAVGKISAGHLDIQVAPPNGTDIALAAMSFGRQLHGLGALRTACLNQHEEAGYTEAEYEALALELEDDIADREFWSRGQW